MNSKELKSRKQALLNYIATGTGTRPKKLYSAEEQLLKEIGDRINSLSTGSVTVEDVLTLAVKQMHFQLTKEKY